MHANQILDPIFHQVLDPCLNTPELVENLFTNGRHLNLSVIFINQNVFYTGKKCRTIFLNSTYIVVFKNPRDQTQIRHLACQMFPSKPKFLQAAYEKEMKDPYRYLFLDYHLNLSVIFVNQNAFYTGKKCRTISLNSTYIVVFKNPRDQTQIRHLAYQMFPSKPKFLQAAYEEEMKDPYMYLFLDVHSN